MSLSPKYADIIRNSVRLSAATALPGTLHPAIDLPALASVWTGMIVAIARRAERPIDKDVAAKLATAVLAGAGAYVAGSKLFTHILVWVPGAGTVSAMGINAALDAWYTYRLGRSLVEQIERSSFTLKDLAQIASNLRACVFGGPSLFDLGDFKDVLLGLHQVAS